MADDDHLRGGEFGIQAKLMDWQNIGVIIVAAVAVFLVLKRGGG